MTVQEHVDLSQILFYRIGGTARYLLEAKSVSDILEAFAFIRNKNINSFLVVGLGSNLLMPDTAYNGAVIWVNKNDAPDIAITPEGHIAVYAGQSLDDLLQFAFQHSFVGLESMGGLPSTVGGAIRGNAGAFGIEIKDVLVSAEVLDIATHQVRTYSNQECDFSYRDSVFKHNHNLIILRGVFALQKADTEAIDQAREVYKEKIEYRNTNHPVEYPSCGSVFKNIREEDEVQKVISVWPDIEDSVRNKWHGKVSMGYVIKRLGFSGIEVGGAKITEKHANYISNVDHAKSSDVLTIIKMIKQKFLLTFGFEPELEAEIVKKS